MALLNTPMQPRGISDKDLSITDMSGIEKRLAPMDIKQPSTPAPKPEFKWEAGEAPEWSKRTPTDYSGMFGHNTSPFDFLNQIHKLDQLKR